ncbi:hypothetical protein Tco_0267686 [Tanacetum coccineum]
MQDETSSSSTDYRVWELATRTIGRRVIKLEGLMEEQVRMKIRPVIRNKARHCSLKVRASEEVFELKNHFTSLLRFGSSSEFSVAHAARQVLSNRLDGRKKRNFLMRSLKRVYVVLSQRILQSPKELLWGANMFLGDKLEQDVKETTLHCNVFTEGRIELTLEQSQQGVSNDVLVSIEGVEEVKKKSMDKGLNKEALQHNLKAETGVQYIAAQSQV